LSYVDYFRELPNIPNENVTLDKNSVHVKVRFFLNEPMRNR